MSVGFNTSLVRSTSYDSLKRNDTQNSYARSYSAASSDDTRKSGGLRFMEYQQRQEQTASKSVVDQAMSYAGKFSETRKKSQEAALEKKKLQYSYKKLSSQIVRSKTSVSAKRAASAARREVQRLKRLKNTGEYDEEELQISIEHAKSMERVAKKKAAHLAQEEMIERTHNGAFASLEEKEEEVQDKESEDRELSEEEMEALRQSEAKELVAEEFAQEQDVLSKEVTDDMILRMEEMTKEQERALRESSEEMNAEMLGAFQDEMEEAQDLTELAETMTAPNPNMSEDDLKMLKIKHRTKEMKEIAQADGDYLKAMFEKMQRDAGGMPGAPSAATFNAFV